MFTELTIGYHSASECVGPALHIRLSIQNQSVRVGPPVPDAALVLYNPGDYVPNMSIPEPRQTCQRLAEH